MWLQSTKETLDDRPKLTSSSHFDSQTIIKSEHHLNLESSQSAMQHKPKPISSIFIFPFVVCFQLLEPSLPWFYFFYFASWTTVGHSYEYWHLVLLQFSTTLYHWLFDRWYSTVFNDVKNTNRWETSIFFIMLALIKKI